MKHYLCSILLIFSCSNANAGDGDSIWNVNFIHDVHLNFQQSPYWDTLLNNYNNDLYTSCEMIFDGVTLPSTGVKFKGNSSFNNSSQKKSFKVDLNEFVSGQDYDGIKKFNLNNGFKDPTFIREKLTLDYMRRHGVFAPRCTYARVYLNNVYWGLYLLVEDVNSKFLSQHYANNNGNLFKGDPQGDLKWYGTTVSSYTSRYELDQSLTNDWQDLIDLIDVINNTTAANYFATLETKLLGQDAINSMVMNNLFVNLDSYCGSGHNYYIYHDSITGVFRWIPWDQNESFGNFNLGMTPQQIKDLPYDYVNQPANRPLATKMLADPTYHQMYVYTYCYFMQDFTNEYLDPYIDSLANLVRPDVYADPNKFYSNQDFENNLTTDIVGSGPGGSNILGLKGFITARRNSLETQLAPLGCYLNTANLSTNTEILTVFPNPAHDILYVTLPAAWQTENVTIEILDISGRKIQSEKVNTPIGTMLINISEISTGTYVLRVTSENEATLSCRFIRSA